MSANLATSTAGSPVRQPEVSGEMEQQAAKIEMLDKQISMLEERLQSVLAERSETSAASTNAPEPVRVALAQRIHDHTHHLGNLSNRLQSIIGRIEL